MNGEKTFAAYISRINITLRVVTAFYYQKKREQYRKKFRKCQII